MNLKLKSENVIFKNTVTDTSKLGSTIDDIGQHRRKSCIRISGVPQFQMEGHNITLYFVKTLSYFRVPRNKHVHPRLSTKTCHTEIIIKFTHTSKRV
jgi:hypothetical protein